MFSELRNGYLLNALHFVTSGRMRQSESFRDYLRYELQLRVNRNASYSLRAFARDLKIGHARLSELLSGKKGLSIQAAIQLAEGLSLNRFERESFLDLVEAECARSGIARERAKTRIDERKKNADEKTVLSTDAFQLVSDWYHFAILALMELPNYQEDLQWIGSQLGISSFQAEEAMKRLERLGLTKFENGRTQPEKDIVFSPDGVSSDAVRKAHHQLLLRVMDALVLIPQKERDFCSYIFPIHSKDLPEIRQKIRTFLQATFDEYSKRPNLDRVVSLSNQLIPLSQV